jgi:RNase adaptor protein for sRNA GlmZ degradation
MAAADQDDLSSHSQNVDASDQFRLRLVSFGYANGPLSRPPPHQLLFSVRDMPSPPARLRKTHTGLSSHLRKEVMAGRGAGERLAKIEDAVLQEMARLEEVWQPSDTRDGRDEDGKIQAEEGSQSHVLQVGMFCEEGKHRSVTFVHELARCKKLKEQDWIISTIHRDLGVSDAETEMLVPTPTGVKRKQRRDRRQGKSRRMNSDSPGSGSD